MQQTVVKRRGYEEGRENRESTTTIAEETSRSNGYSEGVNSRGRAGKSEIRSNQSTSWLAAALAKTQSSLKTRALKGVLVPARRKTLLRLFLRIR